MTEKELKNISDRLRQCTCVNIVYDDEIEKLLMIARLGLPVYMQKQKDVDFKKRHVCEHPLCWCKTPLANY